MKIMLAKHSLASNVHFLDENTACMKYLPEVDRTRQVTDGGFPIVDPKYMTPQLRPALGGECSPLVTESTTRKRSPPPGWDFQAT